MAEAVRSTIEIKRKLLRRAWDGLSKYSGPEMIAMILERQRRAREIPALHVLALHQIDDQEPRSVRALNLLHEEIGNPLRYTGKLPVPGSSSIH